MHSGHFKVGLLKHFCIMALYSCRFLLAKDVILFQIVLSSTPTSWSGEWRCDNNLILWNVSWKARFLKLLSFCNACSEMNEETVIVQSGLILVLKKKPRRSIDGERVWTRKKKWFPVLLVSLFMKSHRVYGWLKPLALMRSPVLLVSLFMKANQVIKAKRCIYLF